MTYCGKKSRRKRIAPPKEGAFYRQIWRIVDGAVMDCFSHHPNYVKKEMARAVRMSIVKRVTGAINGYVGERAAQIVSPSAQSASGDVSGAVNGREELDPCRGALFRHPRGALLTTLPTSFSGAKPRVRVIAPSERIHG